MALFLNRNLRLNNLLKWLYDFPCVACYSPRENLQNLLCKNCLEHLCFAPQYSEPFISCFEPVGPVLRLIQLAEKEKEQKLYILFASFFVVALEELSLSYDYLLKQKNKRLIRAMQKLTKKPVAVEKKHEIGLLCYLNKQKIDPNSIPPHTRVISVI